MTHESGNTVLKSLSCSKGSSKRDVYGNTGLIQTTQIQINNLTSHLKESDQEEQTKGRE